MNKGWCSACGSPCRYLSVRRCDACLAVPFAVEPVEPYAFLLPPGQSFYDGEGWPLPSGTIWTLDDVDPRPERVNAWATPPCSTWSPLKLRAR